MASIARFVSRGAKKNVSVHTQAKRFLNLHEYQSKDLMNQFNIRVQHGCVATTKDEAFKCAEDIQKAGATSIVVKSQIHAGGRGKGHFPATGFEGGVKLCSTPTEAADMADKMLGNALVTKQTPPEGQVVQKVLVHQTLDFEKEYYFAIVMDRTHGGPVLIVSTEGGMDIEHVAETKPEAINVIPIDITEGIQDIHVSKAADILGFTDAIKDDVMVQFKNLYNMFLSLDATQVEINPFIIATNNKAYCLDAKINFDDNASFRQKDVFALRDTSMEDPREVAASAYNLNYIGLDGDIGCMVNGAGLAMATMDVIKLYGGSPANFLDVGGGATAKQVEEAFKIITSDPNVKAMLVNIFGGIMKCDVIAEGIIAAARNLDLKVPLIVRLEGTNVEKGVEMLKNSGLAIIPAMDLDEAAKKAVASIA